MNVEAGSCLWSRLWEIQLEPMLQGTMGLRTTSIKSKQCEEVMPGLLTGLLLFIVVWVGASEHQLVWVAQARISVDLTHPHLQIFVEHQVHAKDLEMSVLRNLVMLLNSLSNVARSVCADGTDLLPKTLFVQLVKAGVVLAQIGHKLLHADLLPSSNKWLLLEVVLLILWLRIQAHVGHVHRWIE